MLLVRLVFAISAAAALSARTLPIQRFEANLLPLSITQDSQDQLWLVTDDGLVRFDGLHFEPVDGPEAVDLSTARQMAAGPDGSIWVGTEKGLLRYRGGAFSTEIQGEVTALYRTRAGRLLATVATPHPVLYISLAPGQYPAHWSPVENITPTSRFQEDLEGNTWFGCSRQICKWSDTDLQAAAAGRRVPSLPALAGHAMGWTNLVATPDHRIWGRNGPDIVQIAGSRVVSRASVPVETFDGVRPGFLLDRRGRLWIPGHKLHVVEDGVLRVAASAPLEEVTTIFQDRRGTLWFGLAGKGLAAIPDRDALESWSEAEGLSGSVLDFAVHPKLGLLAATNTGAYFLRPGEERWQPLPSTAGGTALRSLAVGAAGEVLLLPNGRGLAAGGRSLPLPAGLNPSQLRKVYRDPAGRIWICALPGLFKMEPDGRLSQVPLPHGTYASDVQADAAGGLWVAYEGGIAHCAGDTCTQEIAPSGGLLDARLRTLCARDGEIWAGYRDANAFTRLRREKGRWTATHFAPAQGYGPDDTHFLRRDRRGWIWRGSTDGVYVADGIHLLPEDWIHLSFGERVNASYANMYAFLEQPDGSIWIGTQKGVVRLHPDAGWFQAPAPRILSVPSDRPEFEFHFAQPGLPVYQSRQFRYRLLPADSGWRFSTDGTARYARLPGGAYRLELASGAGRTPVEAKFTVPGGGATHAPWWIALGLVLLAAPGFWLWRRQKAARAARRYWEEKRAFLEARAAEETEDWSGRTLDGRFELQERIAAGGFASVYRARDAQSGEGPVAVKLLDPMREDQQWRRRRFAAEVAALERFDHPGIVRILHTGEAAPDQPYLVMEFIDGITLRALLSAGRLEFDRAAHLLQQTGEALAAAHRAEILHRDLKPENIMVCDAGLASEHIKLIDFGIARAQMEPDGGHTTRLAGSPGYLAPERWVGLESCASDVYSLAAIAWELFTGESYQHGQAPPASLPHPLADLLTAALAYDPQQRPQDAAAFVQELRVFSRPEPPPQRGKR